MESKQMGTCKHGSFSLLDGCKECIEEFAATKRAEQIVKVKYYSDMLEQLSEREYTYYSAEPLKVGDIVIVPVRDTTCKAKVSAVDVPEAEIVNFKDKVKTILVGSMITVDAKVPAYTRLSTSDAPLSAGSTTASSIVQEFQTFVIDEAPKAGFDNQIALVKVKPEEDVLVQAFYKEALGALEYAEARVIVTVDDLLPASDDLLLIRKLKKAMEERRKEYIKPLQDHTKAINDTFKMMMTPIETADEITGGKILAFQLKQTLIREAQEKVNAMRLEAAKIEMETNGELTESVNLIEVIPTPPKLIYTDMGTAGQRNNWKWIVEDLNLVPREYLMINAGMLTPVVKASKGKIIIPGIKIFNDPIIAVKTR